VDKEKYYKEKLESLVNLMFRFKLDYKNNIDLVDKLVSIYSINKKDKKGVPIRILPYEKSILIFYLIHGFNKNTKEIIMSDLKKTEHQINTTNTNLRNKGYLFKDSRNKTKGYVVKDLQDMVDTFLKDGNKVLVTEFRK